MTSDALMRKLRASLDQPLPLPAAGNTAARHLRLMEIGREDLSLARLAEAHWDAVAILAEAGRAAEPGVVYGVWASEKPDAMLRLVGRDGQPAGSVDRAPGESLAVIGTKMFCTGAGLIDRVLLTVSAPEPLLVDVDLRANRGRFEVDGSDWKTAAFGETCTATVRFDGAVVGRQDVVGAPDWYVARAGFWHGACGPAACWAGGAVGLLDYALGSKRADSHTLAHLGAMHASAWSLRAVLEKAGDAIDAEPGDVLFTRTLARTVRHLVEQAGTEMLRRLPRAYGPYPLAMDGEVARRYQELDLYLRQCHAERDLEQLGIDVRAVGVPRA